MARDSSARARDIFASSSRDVTPASARQAACVLYAPVSTDPGVSRYCASVLSGDELHRVDRIVSEHDKERFRQRRAFRRFCGATALGSSRPLSQIVFEETVNGRPRLSGQPDIWFSFSSCGSGLLGAWSSSHGIGVDLEDRARDVDASELARRYFSGAEANAVEGADKEDRLQIFFRLWCLKEAALKSIGEGLPFGLKAFEFALNPDIRVVQAPPEHGGPENFKVHEIEGIGPGAALVLRSLA